MTIRYWCEGCERELEPGKPFFDNEETGELEHMRHLAFACGPLRVMGEDE